MPARLWAGGSVGFEATGSLATPRQEHTATLLPNGQVLVSGGENGSQGSLQSTEIYDPAHGTWSAASTLAGRRHAHTATLLANGQVLAAGGATGLPPPLATAELFDPATATWTGSGSLNHGRFNHTATLLPSGKVLVTGGLGNQPVTSIANAELYDPESRTWTDTGSLHTARDHHTATLLPNGQVLVTGSAISSDSTSAELYDPISGTWTETGSLSTARIFHTATLLPDGKVLVVGGQNQSGLHASAELYDPVSGTWRATGSLITAHSQHGATLLPSGKVLVAGGDSDIAELYDPASETWTDAGRLNTARQGPRATLLPNGKVLMAAGFIYNVGPIASAELYGQSATALLNISTRMRVLTDDQVLIAGFIITGTDPKKVLLRGVGPSLTGVGDNLSDPSLALFQGNTAVITNDNWKTRPDGTSQQAEIEATILAPASDLESAILITLSPGVYTAILSGKDRGTGTGLVELYDLAQASDSRLANISTRGLVDTGDNVMIGGMIVGGGTGNGVARVVVRAIGPSVPIAGALADPTLELRDSSGSLLASNDNWKTRPEGGSQQAEIEATGLAPANDLESALVQNLSAGNYTAIVRGVNNTAGIGLVEAYNLP